jgi:hypothetical protein
MRRRKKRGHRLLEAHVAPSTPPEPVSPVMSRREWLLLALGFLSGAGLRGDQ